jgi:hypothetical protein
MAPANQLPVNPINKSPQIWLSSRDRNTCASPNHPTLIATASSGRCRTNGASKKTGTDTRKAAAANIRHRWPIPIWLNELFKLRLADFTAAPTEVYEDQDLFNNSLIFFT